MNWALKYIGKDVGNCWDFVRLVYKDELGIELPLMDGIFPDIRKIVKAIQENKISSAWRKLEEPEELCAVGMTTATHIHHVGIWTNADGGKIIHTIDDAPVIAQSLIQLKLHGFKRLEYYAYSEA